MLNGFTVLFRSAIATLFLIFFFNTLPFLSVFGFTPFGRSMSSRQYISKGKNAPVWWCVARDTTLEATGQDEAVQTRKIHPWHTLLLPTADVEKGPPPLDLLPFKELQIFMGNKNHSMLHQRF